VSETDAHSDPAESASPTPPDLVSGESDQARFTPEALERIERLVAASLDALSTLPVGSPEYGRAVAAIDQLGERDFVVTSAMSGRVLDRRFGAVSALLAAKAPLARQLADLRKTAARLDPAAIGIRKDHSGHDELAQIDRYFERFARAQPHLEALLGSLTEGRLALERDNAAILTEQASLATEMETLRQYAYLAGRLDEELAVRIGQLAAGDADRARSLHQDVLPLVKRRRQEILTQLAIVMQGYAALRIVEEDNADVIRAVASAIGTTTAALRTAVMVAGAAASHRVALHQLGAARQAADAMSDQAAALEAGVGGPEGLVARLRDAWTEVYAALDRVDEQKARVMRTIADADRTLTRPKTGAG